MPGEIEGEPITDFFALDPRGVAGHSFHGPDRFYVDPATLSPEQAVAQRANIATLRVFTGDPYVHDPKLLRRLGRVPTLAIWGDSDRIVTLAYGRAFADARFDLVANAGRLPQIEQPATFALIDAHGAVIRR